MTPLERGLHLLDWAVRTDGSGVHVSPEEARAVLEELRRLRALEASLGGASVVRDELAAREERP